MEPKEETIHLVVAALVLFSTGVVVGLIFGLLIGSGVGAYNELRRHTDKPQAEAKP